MTVSLEGGVKGYLRSLHTELPDMPEEIPGETYNVLNTNYLTLFATPKLEYWVRRTVFTLDAPVSFAHYTFDKAPANRSEVYFSPSLSMNWKLNNRFSVMLRGGTGRSPMNLNMIRPGYVMADYRTFRQGTADFYNSTSQNVSARFSYRHTQRGLFAGAFVVQSWSHLPYTLSQQLYGDYIVYSYTDAESDGKLLMAGGNIGKTLDFLRGSANINGSFSRNESHLFSQSKAVGSVGTRWSVGAKISGAPLRWLSFDCSTRFSGNRLAVDGAANPWLGGMENTLLVNVKPRAGWEWHIAGEHYRNELSASIYKNVFLLDTRLAYRPARRLELSVSLGNILNRRSYNYTTYSRLSSFESQQRLRGRELLLSISLR